ncbi:recQ-like DNA helicase BLM [Gadus chalcogrammus]|uniref:recQ-like DNA helicase BLM n=1 Tax=Gadus chalcogrammus TaxID=1042646 RepID=UPI0024C4D36B|nr:recQ-like DNA helicase BLM [Gadus chalcogrammus]
MAGNPADQGRDFDRSPENLKAILRKTFRLKEFRDNQLEAINATFEEKYVFVVGDNGAGKSLCYQLPACLSAGVTVVISPLISLIQDQIQKLTELGIEARTLSGDKGCSDADSIYQQLSEEDPIIKLLYVTPEKVRMSDPLIEALQSLRVRGLLARFVIDEAQCISQWGDNFRPDYGTLNELQQDFPGVPIIAVSGPIAPHIQEDILKRLQMTKPQVFTMSFNPTNLKYAVKTRTLDRGTDCITWIKEHYPHDSGIVYCWRQDDCDNMADSLNKAGLLACSYHAGKTGEYRESVQNRWKENKCQVICATIAFGMGIHKPDVRYVIHSVLPKSMERYQRETGRAGRDGNVSHCILFYNYKDYEDLRYVISRVSCSI